MSKGPAGSSQWVTVINICLACLKNKFLEKNRFNLGFYSLKNIRFHVTKAVAPVAPLLLQSMGGTIQP